MTLFFRAEYKWMQRLIVFIFIFLIAAYGCTSIPDTLTVENLPEKFDSQTVDYLCDPEIDSSHRISVQSKSKIFETNGFNLLSWNIQKASRKDWESDLGRLSKNADILIIQEALLTEELRRFLDRSPYHWHLVTAFEYQHLKAGVLTAATIEPNFVCPLRAAEPYIRLPKTVLITRYPLTHAHHSLMIANIHMVNFTLDLSAYLEQVNQMTEVLLKHQGPMILAGDFNTWSEERLEIIEDMASRLKLEAADFKTDLARKIFGYPVDRIFYRGLVLEKAIVIKVTTSDHNPLLVRFREARK